MTTPTYEVKDLAVTAYVGGVVVGQACLGETELGREGGRLRRVEVGVEPAWRRRGIGRRLLLEAARLAASLGSNEIVLSARGADPAVVPMVLAAGLRTRVKLVGDVLTVSVPLRELRPLPREGLSA